MSVVTTSASIFGYTPNYAPLEQVQGLGTDPRSDIYALAATLFHLLTNVKPPDALSRASAIVNGLPDPLPQANTVNPQVSAAVAAVLSQAMSQKRDDRYASASAMRDALRAAAEQPLGDAATVLIGGAAVNAVAMNAEAATMIVGDRTTPLGSEAATLVAADATNVRTPTLPGETATLVQSPVRGKSSRLWLGAMVLLVLVAGGAGGFYAYRARQKTPQSAAPTPEQTAQPSESNQQAGGSQTTSTVIDPAKTNESKTEKKIDTGQRATTSPPAIKSETSQPATDSSNLPSTTHDAARNPDRSPNTGQQQQGPPPFDPSRNPQGRHPPHPPGSGQTPDVKTLPNGTRIVTQPDGTRIVTGPKGRVQVIPPGDRPNRKRNRP